MPVKMLNFVKDPPPPRKYKYGGLVERTAEYQDVILTLGAGLAPNEYVSTTFDKQHPIHRQLKHPLTALRLAIVKKIKALKLPYDCYESEGQIIIVGRGNIA